MALTCKKGRNRIHARTPFVLAHKQKPAAKLRQKDQTMQKIRFYNTSHRNYTITKKGAVKGFELSPNSVVTKNTEKGQEWIIHIDSSTSTQFKIGAGHNQAIVLSDFEATFFPTVNGEGERLPYLAGGRTIGDGS